MPITVKPVSTRDEMEYTFDIRRKVFIEEQHVTEELEFDGKDDGSKHFLALKNGRPIGTFRLVFESEQVKLQRFAVLKRYRKTGVGRLMMESALKEVKAKGCKEVVLEAQLRARAFYEKFGFVAQGDEFMDAGIPHVKMRLISIP